MMTIGKATGGIRAVPELTEPHRPSDRLCSLALALIIAASSPGRAAGTDNPGAETATPSTTSTAMKPSTPSNWILDASTWRAAENLLPVPVLQRVRSGDYWYRVERVDDAAFRANYPQRFWNASLGNQGRYAIDPQSCGLVDADTGAVAQFLEGFPFPTIDKDDPLAGCKVVWNMRGADALGGGQGSSFTINGLDEKGEYKRVKLALQGEHYLPKPLALREQQPDLRFASMLNLNEPLDLDAVAHFAKRTNDATTPDKIWFFVPATRRVRRVNPAVRSEPIADLAVFHEDLGGFASKIEYYKWRLLGDGQVLAPVVATAPLQLKKLSNERFEATPPGVRAVYETPHSDGIAWHVVEGSRLVPRPVWILEGHSEDPYGKFGKVIFYIDKEMYRIYWKLVHDRTGAYFYNAMYSYYWSRNDDGTVAAVTPAFIIGVNDRANRGAIAGRSKTSFVASSFPTGSFEFRQHGGGSD